MATFAEHIKAEIEAKQAEISVLQQHLRNGEAWLQTEASSIWAKLRLFFCHPSSTAIVAAVTPPRAEVIEPPTPPAV